MTDPNRDVKDFLEYYVGFRQAPRYAVLLNGPWGVGKTHFIRNFLDNNLREKQKHFYVTLNGVQSKDDIDIAVISAIYPVLDSKFAKLGGKLLNTGLKFFNIDNPIKLNKILEAAKDGIYVFDDLERTEMSITSVLGYLNDFVEHEGSKVIIIANEDEINDAEGFQKRKEKLIGRTLSVKPDLENAIDSFFDDIADDETQDLYRKYRPEILSTFQQSNVNNLRILQQTLWDFERIYSLLDEVHRKKKDSILDLMKFFIALSLVVKKGEITLENIRHRGNYFSAALRKITQDDIGDTISKIDNRFPDINIRDALLTNEFLEDCFFNGSFDKTALAKQLNRDERFANSDAEPAWRTLWGGPFRDDDQLKTAMNVMEAKYQNREYLVPGEILHVFTMRIWLSGLGLIDDKREEVVNSAKCYIDEIYKSGNLQAVDPANPEDLSVTGYDGFDFRDKESKEFNAFYDYLIPKCHEAFRDQYTAAAPTLLREMSQDVDLFFRRLCRTNSPDNIYVHVPILAKIRPELFMEKFVLLRPKNQQKVMQALSRRYQFGDLERDLSPERIWLDCLRKKLETMADEVTSAFVARRYKLIVEWYLKPILDGDKEEDTEVIDKKGEGES